MSMVTKFALWSFLLLIWVGIVAAKAVWNNQNSPTPVFTEWQQQYKDIAYDLATDPAVKEATQNSPIEVKQVTVLQFNLIKQDGTTQQRVDRCESCHIGLVNPQMTAENIIKAHDHQAVPTDQVVAYLEQHPKTLELVKTIGAHPGIVISGKTDIDLGVAHSPKMMYGVATNASPTEADKAAYENDKINFKRHPFPTFGCTVCHYGSGRELIQDKAHGDPDHWLQPMLPRKYMEATCAQCHSTYNTKTFEIKYLPQMQTIARGEKIFKEKACYGCHKIDGFSKGNIGPELTNEGRTAEVEGIEHQLWDPRYKVGTCVMPYFFSVQQHSMGDSNPNHIVDPRTDPQHMAIAPADIESQDIRDSLALHGYIPDKSKQDDVDALVTFVASQTGQNYADSEASRFATISAYNQSKPVEVPVTLETGKHLFETSGCAACHYIGDPDQPHIVGDPQYGKGGIAGPELSWEGTRHSQEWLIEHYKSPQAFVPGSIMPIFPFSNSQIAALSLYDLSLKSPKAGSRTVSANQDMPTAAQLKYGFKNRNIHYMTR